LTTAVHRRLGKWLFARINPFSKSDPHPAPREPVDLDADSADHTEARDSLIDNTVLAGDEL
jgi:hypothetical protein